ncbi:PucR family transcriptional regulator [Herpetosiphon llansteffanensis]
MLAYQTPIAAPALAFQHVSALVSHLAQIFDGTVTIIDDTKTILATAPSPLGNDDLHHSCQLPVLINGRLGTLIIGTLHPHDLPSLTMLYRLIDHVCRSELHDFVQTSYRFDPPMPAAPMLQRLTFALDAYPAAQQFRYDQAYYLVLIRLGASDQPAELTPSTQHTYDGVRMMTQHLEQILGEPHGWMRFSTTPSELVILIESQRASNYRAAHPCSHQAACCCPIQTVANHIFERLTALLGTEIRIGIAREQSDHTTVTKAYAEAEMIIQIGSRFQLPAHAWTLEKLGLFAFLGSADRAIQTYVARLILAPLIAEPDLLLTLRSFIRLNGHSNEIASDVHIHRNTLSYRLHKMQELTGYNPYNLSDMLVFQSALLIYDNGIVPAA